MKKKIPLILCCGLLVGLLSGCGGTDYTKLEKDLTTKASKYYEDNLKGKVLGVTSHQVTLTALQAAKVDVTEFTDAKCKTTSYALINLKFNDKREITGYSVENHLSCGSYTTSNK